MAIPKSLPQVQGKYAVTAASRGEVIHNGDVITTYPTRKGFHAVFNPKNGSTRYVGPFETQNEAYSVGLGYAEFSKVISI